MILLGLALAQAVMQVPATAPGPLPPPTGPVTLVMADTVDQADPQPRCKVPGCTLLFLGRFRNARTIAGPALPHEFAARLEMGSPYNRSYRLLLVVEHRAGQEPLIHAERGKNYSSGLYCLDRADAALVGPVPDGGGVTHDNGKLCVAE